MSFESWSAIRLVSFGKMSKSIILVSTLLCVAFTPAHASPKWQQLLDAGIKAENEGDASFAIYKMRRAWESVPDKNFSAKPYKNIATALQRAARKSETAKHVLNGTETMEEIDRFVKRREFNGSGDQFSVKMRADRALEFNMLRLDQEPSVSICGNILTDIKTDQQKKDFAKWVENSNAAQRRWQAEMKSKMPIVFKPDSPRYLELLALCQPIKPGELKSETGFDLSPFIAKEFKGTPDL